MAATKVKLTEAEKVTVIEDVAHGIENLTTETAFSEATNLIDSIDQNYFKLGGVLSVIQTNGYFADKGYETFKECVEAEFGMRYRKAAYLVNIYTSLVNAEIDWEKVKDLGWTKLSKLAGSLTQENVDELAELARGMTVLQLEEYLAQKKGDGEGAEGVEKATNSVTTMTFKVHAEQKETIRETLDAVKAEIETDVDAVALENVCLSYLNTGSKPKQKQLKTQMKDAGWEKVLDLFGTIWPDIDLEVIAPEEEEEPA